MSFVKVANHFLIGESIARPLPMFYKGMIFDKSRRFSLIQFLSIWSLSRYLHLTNIILLVFAVDDTVLCVRCYLLTPPHPTNY